MNSGRLQSNLSGQQSSAAWRVACVAAAALVLLTGVAWAQVPSYTISTFAGNGTAGFSGDSGPATSAELNYPSGMVVDGSGNLYFADQINHRIRKIDTSGNITTVAGNGTASYSGDGGAATSAALDAPCGVAVDSSGNIYIADTHNNVVRKISSGNISTIAGIKTAGYTGDTGLATKATLNAPVGLAVDSAGNIYIADSGNNVIRKITTDGNINTIVGNGYADFYGVNIAALQSSLNHPLGIVLDAAGNLFIADQLNQRIRRVDATSGIITTVAGSGILYGKDSGNLAIDAGLLDPSWVTVDKNGNLFIADMLNNIVRRVATDGTIANVAGNGQIGTYGDGGPALHAAITFPLGVAVNAAGNVFISQGENNVIRMLTPAQPSGTSFHRHDLPALEVEPRPASPHASTGRVF